MQYGKRDGWVARGRAWGKYEGSRDVPLCTTSLHLERVKRVPARRHSCCVFSFIASSVDSRRERDVQDLAVCAGKLSGMLFGMSC